jgi:hypothetical protein
VSEVLKIVLRLNEISISHERILKNGKKTKLKEQDLTLTLTKIDSLFPMYIA